ncbi:hypothetical protein OS493_029051 [Desmophyllum pertusum]|uniref:Uncharacterized protein n=1 Tax=Desmophyllum pertusum TaxID=174260 RepID=A0A9X0CK82_9CNID|nr:hypothetical protein OS493_029051 [Desmophyllum pertusum]
MATVSDDGFGSFMRNLEEKPLAEIDRAYFGRQNGAVLRKYLIAHGVQTSDMGKAYNKEKLTNLAFQAWRLRLQHISVDSEDTSVLILEKTQYSRWPSSLGVIYHRGMVQRIFKCT